MSSQFSSIDEYLASLAEEQRAALAHLRSVIHAAAPEAEECFSYGMPVFRIDKKVLVGFAAAKHHCALYPMSGNTVEEFKEELTGYSTSSGTIRFTASHPLPDSLVQRIVASRIAAI